MVENAANDQMTDEELMDLYQMGDFHAFDILYKRHSGRVFNYLKGKTSPEIAQELLQDVFEKLHRSRDKYTSQYPFLPWLFTIARNSTTDFFKKAETKLAQTSHSSATILDNLAVVSTGDGQPLSADISDILKSLPANQKRAIELRYLSEWSFEKIAGSLNASEENVRKLVSRGIKKIQSVLSSKGGPKNE